MKRQAGFTLIELVMVIVILGILAAFALPRFADLGNEARAAALQGAFGAIKSASSIAHADFLVGGDADAGTAGIQVILEGTTVNMINGYPQAQAAGSGGILDAAQVTTGANGDFDVDVTNAGAAAGAVIIVQAKGATDAANCQISYTAPGASASPTITIVDTGC